MARWALGRSHEETVEMTLEEAIAVVTGEGQPDPDPREASSKPEVCGACGAMIMLMRTHARHHVAVAVIGEYTRRAFEQESQG